MENPKQSKTILVVDDEDVILHVARRILEKAGYRVLVASNGIEAVELCKHDPTIDVLIIDMVMPEMDGLETYHTLTAMKYQAKFILTSAYHETEQTQHLIETGQVAFLQKPYHFDQLLQTVALVLS